MSSSRAWCTDKPPVGKVVEVWFLTDVLVAKWTGTRWETPEGAYFVDGIITHWRERA